MDDKLRLERNSLKSALDATHGVELSKAVDAAKKEAERDSKLTEKRLQEDNDKLQYQIIGLQRQINELKQQVVESVNEATKEGDKKVY